MKLLTAIIYSLTFFYIVYGNADIYMPSPVKDEGGQTDGQLDGQPEGQIDGQTDNPVNNPIDQDETPAATQPAVVTTPSTDLSEIFKQKPLLLKLISKASKVDHNEDKNHRSFIVTNVEAYKLPSNNLLIRSRFIGAIDWIIPKPGFENKILPFHKPGPPVNHEPSANHLKILRRNKRQADSYGMPNPNPMNGQEGPMRPGDQPVGNPMGNPMDNPMGSNPIDRVRQFFGRLRQIMNDIGRAWTGNSRVDTNMQGMGNMPGMNDMQNPNVPK